MKPLILLIAVFTISAVTAKFSTGNWNLVFSGNLAMCIMLCFTAFGHFKFSKGMTMMLPGVIPFKTQLVFFTGIAEIVFGLALSLPYLRYWAGLILIALFILMLHANIYAAFNHINYETAAYDGKGPGYLWFRVPMQVVFILWVLYFSVKK
jgi:uncharacterized membrane protein